MFERANLRPMPGYPKNNLKSLREARGWSQRQAAEAFRMSYGGYIKIENSERKLTAAMAVRAAEIYSCSADDVLDLTGVVPVIGYAGAGAELSFFSSADTPWGEASMPPGGNVNTVAVQIRGTSLGSFYDGWFAYYDNVQTPPDDRVLRKLCVVGLEDGRVLIKKMIPGSKPGLYHLTSQTEAPIEDVKVEWAAVVKALTPQ